MDAQLRVSNCLVQRASCARREPARSTCRVGWDRKKARGLSTVGRILPSCERVRAAMSELTLGMVSVVRHARNHHTRDVK